MSSVNRVFILGRLGQDPEVRHLDNGNQVARLNIATSETYKDKSGQKVENTTWHNVVLWNKTAEIAEKYIKKGDQVHIEGKIQTRTWEKDGVKQYTTEIVGSNLTMLGKSKNEPAETTGYAEVVEEENSDLPF